MRDDNKSRRQEQIAAAAYKLLESKGFGGTSMLAIAREAKASNETLYNWYGDKTGLFRALVTRNTEQIRAELAQAIEGKADPLDTLRQIGPMLLRMLTGPRAVALNRAAAADTSGVLSDALSSLGRGVVAPMIGSVLERLRAEGQLKFDDSDAVLDTYLSLLIGDLQIRAVAGRTPPITKAEATARSDRAITYLMRLFG